MVARSGLVAQPKSRREDRVLPGGEAPPASPVADAGAGVVEAKNPFSSLMLRPFDTPDEYEQVAKPKEPAGAKATEAAAAAGAGTAGRLIERAKQFIGTPYKWGGTSPLGFDCSGFTQFLYKELGINLPRVSYQQATSGKRVSMDQARPGDLVAWDSSGRNPGADHIAVYLGGGMVIHAPKPGDAVKISKVWGNPWAVSMNL